MLPVISIITINYNNCKGLAKTITSVVSQDYSSIEYIVIDGGSTDGSVEEIKKEENHIQFWLSEPDNGIYHAMNKGIEKATGEYLLFLNSGDALKETGSLQSLYSKGNSADIIYGDILFVTAGGLEPCLFPSDITFDYLITGTNSLPHCSSLIRRNLFDVVGLYNETMKICADWEFFLLAICKYNFTYKHVPELITVFDFTGISAQSSNMSFINEERRNSVRKNFPAFISDYEHYHEALEELKALKKGIGFRIENKIQKMFN